MQVEVFDTPKRLADLVDRIAHVHSERRYEPALYIDLEGKDLCREGTISILTLALDIGTPEMYVAVIDVSTLGHQAFDTAGIEHKNLRQILEDSKVSKVFFDARNDSDALFAHYGVAMQGVEDVQLMESATRTTTASRRFLNGLNKCVERSYIHIEIFGRIDCAKWRLAKDEGESLFKAEQGGSGKVFDIRPIPKVIINYCAGDVQCLPSLYKKYRHGNNTTAWKDLIKEVSQQRVIDSQQPSYQPHGQHRVLAPWTDLQNKMLDEMNYRPSRDYFDDDMEGDMFEDDMEADIFEDDMEYDAYEDDWGYD